MLQKFPNVEHHLTSSLIWMTWNHLRSQDLEKMVLTYGSQKKFMKQKFWELMISEVMSLSYV